MTADHVADLRQADGASPTEVRGRIVLCLPVLPRLEDRIRGLPLYCETGTGKPFHLASAAVDSAPTE